MLRSLCCHGAVLWCVAARSCVRLPARLCGSAALQHAASVAWHILPAPGVLAHTSRVHVLPQLLTRCTCTCPAPWCRSDAYHQVALLGLEKKKDLHGLDRTKFERAPEAAVRHALAYVARRWGSLPAYMEHAGFPAWRQARLGALLCKPHIASAL
jgi:hypothetical protein